MSIVIEKEKEKESRNGKRKCERKGSRIWISYLGIDGSGWVTDSLWLKILGVLIFQKLRWMIRFYMFWLIPNSPIEKYLPP